MHLSDLLGHWYWGWLIWNWLRSEDTCIPFLSQYSCSYSLTPVKERSLPRGPSEETFRFIIQVIFIVWPVDDQQAHFYLCLLPQQMFIVLSLYKAFCLSSKGYRTTRSLPVSLQTSITATDDGEHKEFEAAIPTCRLLKPIPLCGKL